MYCSSCGKQFPDENRFCPYCGTENVLMKMQNEAETTAAEPAPVPAPAGAPQPEAGKKKNTVLYIIIGVLCVALIALAATLLSGKKDRKTEQPQAPAAETAVQEAGEPAAGEPEETVIESVFLSEDDYVFPVTVTKANQSSFDAFDLLKYLSTEGPSKERLEDANNFQRGDEDNYVFETTSDYYLGFEAESLSVQFTFVDDLVHYMVYSMHTLSDDEMGAVLEKADGLLQYYFGTTETAKTYTYSNPGNETMFSDSAELMKTACAEGVAEDQVYFMSFDMGDYKVNVNINNRTDASPCIAVVFLDKD